jgi:hypothetical protein
MSKQSSTLSSGQQASASPSTDVSVRIAITSQSQQKSFSWPELVPATPGVLATLFAIWAVHKLTRGREREKAVFDLYKAISDSLEPLKQATHRAWTTRAGPERRAAVAEAKWRLQQLGGSAERLRKLSKRKRWLTLPPGRDVTVVLTSAMKDLRDNLTADPFEDPSRKIDRGRSEAVEQYVGEFLLKLDEGFFMWIR